MARNKMLGPNDAMPDVELSGPNGKRIRLRELTRDKVLVVYFYPRDDSPGCTVESCTFRDQYEDFVRAGAEVIGISADPPSSHQQFATKHRLPFLLLSDEDGSARAAFGVPTAFGILPGRVTFIVDRTGMVRHAFESQIRLRAHVDKALEVVEALAREHTAQPPT